MEVLLLCYGGDKIQIRVFSQMCFMYFFCLFCLFVKQALGIKNANITTFLSL